jgi:hypothetical protein
MGKILSSAMHYQKMYIGKMINSSYIHDDAKIYGLYDHSGTITTFSHLYFSFYHQTRPVYATYIVSCLKGAA